MKTLIWQGIAFQSLEYFSLKENDKDIQVTSKIIGCYESKIYTVAYQLTIDPDWNIRGFTIECEINTIKNILTGKKYENAPADLPFLHIASKMFLSLITLLFTFYIL